MASQNLASPVPVERRADVSNSRREGSVVALPSTRDLELIRSIDAKADRTR
jgi:hypothetical protein